MLANPAAARTGVEAGSPPRQRHDSQEIGIQDAARRVIPARKRTQSSQQQQILRRGGLRLAQTIRGLDHGVRSRVSVVVQGDVRPVGAEAVCLLHDVQGTPLIQEDVSDHERFEPGTEAGGRATDSFGHRADLAVAAAQEGDDAIRFTQLVGAQDHDLVAIGGHQPCAHAGHSPRSSMEWSTSV